MTDTTGEDVEAAQVVQRFPRFRDDQPDGVIDAKSGLTTSDLDRIFQLAASAQATKLRELAEADASAADPVQIVDVMTSAILHALAETSERVLGAPGLNANHAYEAMAMTLAVLVTGDVNYATTKTIREDIDTVAKLAKVNAGKLRDIQQKTGHHALAAGRPSGN